MKKNLLKYVAVFAIIAIAILACQKENELQIETSVTTEVAQKTERVDTNQLTEILREYKGRSVEANFIGRIIGPEDQPISGAIVTLGGQQQTTDDNGIVTFINAVVNENFAYASASANGYSNGSRVMVPIYSPNNQNSFTIKLFSLENSQIIASTGGEVTIETALDRAAIIVFNNGFEDENGNPYTGNVSVSVNHLDPLSEDTANTMPGELYGIDQNYQEVTLGSYGMINVELRGNAGQKLQITNPARIMMPIHTNQMATAPSQVPMWSFNEDTGVWLEETVAYRNGDYYVSDVDHFSFWNCDAPFPVVNFNATVTDVNTGNPVAGLKVTISYSNFSRYATTNSNGNVSGKIPSGQVMTLTITDLCGTVLYSNTNFGPFNSATNITIPVTLLPTSTINVSGSVLNCSASPVTNGYVTYSSTSGQFFGTSLVTAGTHSYTAVSCSIPISIDLLGGDMSTGQTIAAITVIANPNAIANLNACAGTAAEYIRYSINGNPIQYEIQNPHGSLEPPNYVSLGSVSANGNGTLIIGNTTTLGTYPFDSNPFSTTLPSMAIKRLGDINGINPASSAGVVGAITFTITNFGPIGSYIDVSFTGNYIDLLGNASTITGDVHVLRDN